MTIAERLNLAVAAFSRGDLPEARRQGEAALRIHPNNPAVLQLLGVVLCQAGEVRRGADYFRKAMRAGLDTPDMRLNLARALAELGELEEAERISRPQEDGPPSPDLQRMHSDILKAQGRAFEAVASYEKLLEARPDDFEGWNNLGNARHSAGDLDGALVALQQARLLNPQSSIVHTNIGRVLISKDRYEDACLMLEQAAKLAPADPTPLLELGRTLASIGHPAAGLRALGSAARLNSGDPEIFVAIGLAFVDLADLRQAEQAYRFALKADRTHAPAYLNLGMLLEKANRLDDLDRLIAEAEAARISGPELDYLLAVAASRKGELTEALELARPVQSSAISSAVVAQFVGQLADRLDRTDEAFAAFEAMNQAAAESPLGVGIDRGAYQRAIEGLAVQTTPEWFESWRDAPGPGARQAPAFLVGFPRSGTTLLDTLLMGHSGTHVLEEIPLLDKVSEAIGGFQRIGHIGEAEIADLRALYFAELDKVSPPTAGALVIDKNPLSMIRIPLIHRLFPDAKIILAMRHPCDVILSCYMQNFKVTEAMASFLDLHNASRTYDRVFAYWEQCRDIFPIDVHTLRYENMVADTEGAVRPLIEFLGLAWEEDLLDHQRTAVDRGYIRTPSYAQVTEDIYTSASGRWTRYRGRMRDVLPILAPWVERYGYTLD